MDARDGLEVVVMGAVVQMRGLTRELDLSRKLDQVR
jgi:hypothetical protein